MIEEIETKWGRRWVVDSVSENDPYGCPRCAELFSPLAAVYYVEPCCEECLDKQEASRLSLHETPGFNEWAFGEGFEITTKMANIPALWNDLHGYEYPISVEDDLHESLVRMQELWEEYKNEVSDGQLNNLF